MAEILSYGPDRIIEDSVEHKLIYDGDAMIYEHGYWIKKHDFYLNALYPGRFSWTVNEETKQFTLTRIDCFDDWTGNKKGDK